MAPIVLGRGGHTRIRSLRRRIASDRAAGIEQHRDQRGQMGGCNGRVHEQRFCGAADAGAAQLRIQHDRLGAFEIGRAIDEDMNQPLEMREDGHAGFRLDASDQGLPAPRHDDVDRSTEPAQQGADCGAIPRGHKRDRRIGEAGRAQAGEETGVNGARRVKTFRAPAQDAGIAGLEAERARVGRDVGPALEDDTDHAQGGRHPLNDESVGAVVASQAPAHRIGQGRDRLDARRNRLDARGIELEPIEHGGRETLADAVGHVAGICLDDGRAARPHG